MNPVGESRKNDCCIVVKGLMCIQPPACKSLLGRVYVLMIHDEENQVRIRYKTSSRTPLLRSFSFFSQTTEKQLSKQTHTLRY